MFLKIWVGERNTGRIMNEPGKPFVDRYVTKGWKSATMERSGGKGTLGEIFLTLTLSSRPIRKRIFGTISEGGGREEQLEWKHPKNPQKRTTEVIRCFFFFSFTIESFYCLEFPPQEEIDDKFYIQGGIVYVYARVTKKQYFTYYASFFQFFLQAYNLFESLYILFKYDSITGVKFEK